MYVRLLNLREIQMITSKMFPIVSCLLFYKLFVRRWIIVTINNYLDDDN